MSVAFCQEALRVRGIGYFNVQFGLLVTALGYPFFVMEQKVKFSQRFLRFLTRATSPPPKYGCPKKRCSVRRQFLIQRQCVRHRLTPPKLGAPELSPWQVA